MVNREQLEEKYLENGLTHFQLQSIADLLAVHGIEISDIAGYSGLNDDNRQVFDGFIINYLNAQGMDDRGEIVPLGVRFVREGAERYLRFDLMRNNGRDAWVHVTSSHTWY